MKNGNDVHEFINKRVFIIQNRDVFNELSKKFNESGILYQQFVYYSLKGDDKKAIL